MVKNTIPLLMNGLQLSKADGQVSTRKLPYIHSEADLVAIDALIQFEDFKYPHAYNLLNKCKYTFIVPL
jgi:hypothetical protein